MDEADYYKNSDSVHSGIRSMDEIDKANNNAYDKNFDTKTSANIKILQIVKILIFSILFLFLMLLLSLLPLLFLVLPLSLLSLPFLVV